MYYTSSDTNINELPAIKNFMKKRTKSFLKNFLFLALFIGCFVSMIIATLNNENSGAKITDFIPLFFFILIIAAFAVSSFIAWIRSFSEKVNEYWFVTISNMYIDRKRTNKGRIKRKYYIVADVNEKNMEAQCSLKVYNRAQKGDEVLFFTIGDSEMYCVYPE